MNDSKQYNCIDLLKFIMAVLVVVLHTQPFLDVSRFWNYVFLQGLTRVAVPFFFVASGFFLFRHMTPNNIDWIRIKKYCWRIFRAYCVWTMIYSPIIIHNMSKDNREWEIVILAEIKDFIFTGFWQLWFLPSLIVAILLTAWLLFKRWNVLSVIVCASILYLVVLGGYSYYGLFVYFFPEGSVPFVLVHYMSKILYTPRNGIFMGFVFVSFGSALAFYKPRVSKRGLLLGCIISWLMLAGETIIVHQSHLMLKNADAYIFLIPVSVFTFLFGIYIKWQDAKIFVWMRKMSMFIYYVHIWFLILFNWLSSHIIHLNSMEVFLCVIVFSILTAVAIIRLSSCERFKWMKILY